MPSRLLEGDSALVTGAGRGIGKAIADAIEQEGARVFRADVADAEIVRTPTSALVVDTMMKENYEVAAGVKQALENEARRVAGVRLLPGRFMVINQAMASQRGKEAGARYLREFVEEMKASGFVAKALERHKQTSAVVAPAGDAK